MDPKKTWSYAEYICFFSLYDSAEMVNDAVIPVAALGSQYYGGPVVTILASKTSRKLLGGRVST